MWSQTPQFDLSLDPSDDVGIGMNVHHGIIKSLEFKDSRIAVETQDDLRQVLLQQKLQDIGEWEPFLQDRLKTWDEPLAQLAKRLDTVLPIPELPKLRK